MSKFNLLKILFILSSITIVIGAWFKIVHLPHANALLIIGMSVLLLYTIIVLSEIFSSNKVRALEKIVWTFGFIFMNWVTGLLYLLLRKSRVL